MNILKKKLYYKFLDLQRLSRFTGEVGLCDFAISVLNKIKNISDENFDVELYDTKKSKFSSLMFLILFSTEIAKSQT